MLHGGFSEIDGADFFRTTLPEGILASPAAVVEAITAKIYEAPPELALSFRLSQKAHLERTSIYRYQMRLGDYRLFPDRLTLAFNGDRRLKMVAGELHPIQMAAVPEEPALFSMTLLTKIGFDGFELIEKPQRVVYTPTARMAWLLYPENQRTHEAYELALGDDGGVLMERSLARDLQAEDGPQGLIYPEGSPQPRWPLGSPPPPYANREMVSLAGSIDMNRRPMVLEGPTVRTLDDRLGDRRAILSDVGNGCEFCAPLQLTGPLPPDPAASGVNAHYWAARAHDHLKTLGFTTEAGNFEGDDPMLVLEQTVSPRLRNNSMFVGAPDGASGKILLFPWDGNPDRSSALDSSIVLHEYGHGLTSRLTGFWGVLGEATDEAVADTVAFVVRGYPPDANVAIGAYAAQNPKGVRLYPYSTDPSIDPVSFANFPLLGVSGAKPEKHYMGEILASTLWGVRARLIDKYGPDDGSTRFGKLMMGTLMLVSSFPTFPEFKDTLLSVDKLIYGAADIDLIWDACAKKKLGFLAYTNRETFQDPFWSMISEDTPTHVPVAKAKVGYNSGRPQLLWFVLGDQDNLTTVTTVLVRSAKTNDAIGLLVRRDGSVFSSPPIFVVADAPAGYPKLKTGPQDTVIIRYGSKEFQIPLN